MSRVFERINALFEKELPNHPKMEEAFDAANDKFRDQCGFSAYKDYGSFSTSRSRKLRNKKR